jgi:3-hydroxyacyl-[acyl-carrier-protein] dehydratase
MKYIGREEIYKVIPNRYPLMLLETLNVEDDVAVSEIHLKGDEWFFQCHFPGNPIMPLTLLIECMAQTFISVFLQKLNTTEIPLFSSLGDGNKIAYREKLEPGDKLTIVATLLSLKWGLAKGQIKAYKNDSEQPILEFQMVEAIPSQMIRMS